MARTGQQRLDAILPAIAARDEFQARVVQAEGDAVKCADLMAEAIALLREANFLEVIGRDGRVTVSIEKVTAGHCMHDAREAYLRARGSNQP